MCYSVKNITLPKLRALSLAVSRYVPKCMRTNVLEASGIFIFSSCRDFIFALNIFRPKCDSSIFAKMNPKLSPRMAQQQTQQIYKFCLLPPTHLLPPALLY